MPSDTSDARDVREVADTVQESTGMTRRLGPAGMKAMRGEDDDAADLAKQLQEAEAQAAACDAAAWAELETKQSETPPNDVPGPPEPQDPQDQGLADDPDIAPRPTIVGERGLAEWVESGPEKPEKEIFTGFGRGIEDGG